MIILENLPLKDLKNTRLASKEFNDLSHSYFMKTAFINVSQHSLMKIPPTYKNFKISNIRDSKVTKNLLDRKPHSLIIDVSKTSQREDFEEFLQKCSRISNLNLFVNSYKFLNPIKMITRQLSDSVVDSTLILKADSISALFFQVKCLMEIAQNLSVSSVKIGNTFKPDYKISRLSNKDFQFPKRYRLCKLKPRKIMLEENFNEFNQNCSANLETMFFKNDLDEICEGDLKTRELISYFFKEIVKDKIYNWSLETQITSLVIVKVEINNSALDSILKQSNVKKIKFYGCNFVNIDLKKSYIDFFKKLDKLLIQQEVNQDNIIMSIDFFNFLVKDVRIFHEKYGFKVELFDLEKKEPQFTEYIGNQHFKRIFLLTLTKVDQLKVILKNIPNLESITVRISYTDLVNAIEIGASHPQTKFVFEVPSKKVHKELKTLENIEITFIENVSKYSYSCYFMTNTGESLIICEKEKITRNEESTSKNEILRSKGSQKLRAIFTTQEISIYNEDELFALLEQIWKAKIIYKVNLFLEKFQHINIFQNLENVHDLKNWEMRIGAVSSSIYSVHGKVHCLTDLETYFETYTLCDSFHFTFEIDEEMDYEIQPIHHKLDFLLNICNPISENILRKLMQALEGHRNKLTMGLKMKKIPETFFINFLRIFKGCLERFEIYGNFEYDYEGDIYLELKFLDGLTVVSDTNCSRIINKLSIPGLKYLELNFPINSILDFKEILDNKRLYRFQFHVLINDLYSNLERFFEYFIGTFSIHILVIPSDVQKENESQQIVRIMEDIDLLVNRRFKHVKASHSRNNRLVYDISLGDVDTLREIDLTTSKFIDTLMLLGIDFSRFQKVNKENVKNTNEFPDFEDRNEPLDEEQML
ncbi:hypothetical protein ACFFRR_008432 [Megaselia abdita]